MTSVSAGARRSSRRTATALFRRPVTADGNNSIVNDAVDNINSIGRPFPVGLPNLDDRFNVNLPVANPAGSLRWRSSTTITSIDLELSALQAEGRGEVISSPRVITANQKEANIKQGVEIPYQEASSSGATTTSVQGGGAEPDGDAADHAGQPDHHGSAGDQGQRRRAS